MNRRKIRLKLECSLEKLEGCGDELTFRVSAHRKMRSGDYDFYELQLKACRYSVTSLLQQLRAMHVRDRERLAREESRIKGEVRALTEEA